MINSLRSSPYNPDNHLLNFQTLDRTMCEDTVFWDLNYAMKYKSLVSENILTKVLKVNLNLFFIVTRNYLKLSIMHMV